MPNTVGILSPGDMGHTVGNVLRQNGLRVITCLEGRSQRTRELAEKAGIVDVPTYPQFVTEADLILSIMVPAQAMSAASIVAETLQQVDTTLTYTDCNAIAPQTVRKLGDDHHLGRWNVRRCLHHRSTPSHTRSDAVLRIGTGPRPIFRTQQLWIRCACARRGDRTRFGD